MDEELITQMGLLFTQMRYMRRALEAIERNTAQYTGVTFAAALSEGPRFGVPPMFQGALKVYVVNINELNSGGGLGLFEALLGGAGRFIGNLFGGLVGGTVAGFVMPQSLADMARLADKVDSIMARLGTSPQASGTDTGPSTLVGQLEMLTRVVDALTRMFRAGSEAPTVTTGPTAPATPGEFPFHQTLPILQTVSHIVDGLILLIPILTGAFASFLLKIDEIKFRILDLMEFLLRNTLLLRGIAVVTIYDTIASAAALGGRILGILSTQLDSILGSVFSAVESAATGVIALIRFIGPALAATLNAVLVFLREGIGNVLVFIGNTRVFRLLFHLVNALPSLLPGLIELRTGSPPSAASTTALGTAPTFSAALAPYVTPSGTLPTFTNIQNPFAQADVDTMTANLRSAGTAIRTDMQSALTTGQTMLNQVGAELRSAVTTGEQNFQQGLDTHRIDITASSRAFTEALRPARDLAAQDTDSSLTEIARAYQDWLTHGGFDVLLGRISSHFEHTPAVPGAVAAGAAAAQPGATVEIGRVEIVVRPGPVSAVPAANHAEPVAFQDEEDDILVRPYRGYDPHPVTA